MVGYKYYHMLYPRKVFSEIQKVILRDESIILTGARQVGKTSLLILLKHFWKSRENLVIILIWKIPII